MRKDLEAARDQQIVELIHKNTLRILEEIGIAFLSDSALDLLRQNGVRVEGNRAYFTEKQVMDAMDADKKAALDAFMLELGMSQSDMDKVWNK